MPVVDAAMNRSRILARLSLIGFLVSVSTTASAQDVVWTDQIHVTVAGTTLQKTSGCDGCADAGARSQQEIAAGDGHIKDAEGEPGRDGRLFRLDEQHRRQSPGRLHREGPGRIADGWTVGADPRVGPGADTQVRPYERSAVVSQRDRRIDARRAAGGYECRE
jgi:hypothetical protein